MTTRTNKLLGRIWGDPANPATITVNFNGAQVYTGTAPTVAGVLESPYLGELDTLCQWSDDTSVTGLIPVSVSVLNGSLLVSHVAVTHYRGSHSFALNPGAVWPSHVPATAEEVTTDARLLDATAFESKYGLTKDQASANYTVTIVTPPEEFFTDPNINSLESDGKFNIKIDGVAQIRDTTRFPIGGEWRWAVGSGSTIEFDFEILDH
jgi:hypothetical protein